MKFKFVKKLKLYTTLLRDFYSTQIHIGDRILYSLHYRKIAISLVGTMCTLVGASLVSIDHPLDKFGAWLGMTAQAATLNEYSSKEKEASAKARGKSAVRGAGREDYEISLITSSSQDLTDNNFLRVRLVNEIDTGNERSPIVFRVLESFDRRIPEGALALGSVEESKGDRVYGKVVAIKTGEDEGFELRGEIMSVDGSSGLVGEVDTHRGSALAGTAIGSFVAGAAAGLIQSTPFQLGGFRENLRNSMLAGTSETANKAAEIYTNDMKNQRATIRIKRGSEAVILIRSF